MKLEQDVENKERRVWKAETMMMERKEEVLKGKRNVENVYREMGQKRRRNNVGK